MTQYICAEKVYTVDEMPLLPKFHIQYPKRGNQGNNAHLRYGDYVCAFDIETTNIDEIRQSVMYIWQFQFDFYYTIIGRTWFEFKQLLEILKNWLPDKTRLCVFVHNLSFEFQFLRAVYDFQSTEVFAIDNRKVLKCSMWNKIEFRCSYLHSNMSLDIYTSKFNASHKKLSGEDFNYSEQRFFYTELTEKQMEYCLNDVRGLVEAIKNEMVFDGDNIYTFPMTSTGYVRRDAKRAVANGKKNLARDIFPEYRVYKLLREGFRGGDTHANRYYSGKIIENVKSKDRSSSYPDVLCNCQYPISEFLEEEPNTERLFELMEKRGKACLFRCHFKNIALTNELNGFPYLPRDKCSRIAGDEIDNGRILKAGYIETVLTDIDFRIVLKEYKWESFEVLELYSARYGYLPREIINLNIMYYRKKTELKDVEGKELFYMKSKNKLNSIYGMMAQNPVRKTILFDGVSFTPDDEYVECVEYEKVKHKSFLCYQWGVWTTAWARYRLREGLWICGAGAVYVDTDSVKYIGDYEKDFTAYNKKRIADSKNSGAYARDSNGVTHYMGVFEDEKPYDRFITLGAKKYAYDQKGKTGVTVAGVNKKTGGAELAAKGGLEVFAEGFVFKDAGGTNSVYNDIIVNPIYKNKDGVYLEITPNIFIEDSEYTLGISGEYRRLLTKYLDFSQYDDV